MPVVWLPSLRLKWGLWNFPALFILLVDSLQSDGRVVKKPSVS